MIKRQLVEGEESPNISKTTLSTPLVFVPGIMGSQLWQVGPESRRIWPFWHWTAGEFRFETIKLLVEAPQKVATDVIPDVYAGLILAIENMGYTLNHNFWIFPYDWTQSNEISGQHLANFIKKKIKGKWEEADVVAHSMGGIVTRAAHVLYQAPIRRTVYLAVPHLGTPKAFFSLKENIKVDFFRLPGFVANIIWRKYARKLGDENNLRKQLKWVGEQLPSMYELLPDHLYLSDTHPMVSGLYAHAQGPGWDMTETIVKPLIGVDATYFSDKYSCFDSTEQLARIDKAMQFKKSLGNQMLGNSLAIYSDTEETSDSINRYIHVRGAEMPWGWTKPRDSGQHGDGVVPTDSATAFCTQAKNIGGTHLGVPNKRHAHIQIANFLGEL